VGLELPFSTEDLTRLYRFALLLTGEDGAAQQVIHDACVDSAARLGSYRNEESRLACMIGSLRQKAKTMTAAEGTGMARAFAALPEEERAALAGLYSGLLSARDLAEALKISLDQLGGLLKSAREHLGSNGLEMDNPSLEKVL